MFKTKIALLALSLVVAMPMLAQASTATQKSTPYACPAGEFHDDDGQCGPIGSGSGAGPVHHREHHREGGR